MTPEAIRKECAALKERLFDAQKVVRIVEAEMGVLQDRCDHPAKFATSYMGDSGEHCPDCGWSV